MPLPGSRLRAWASRWCDERTVRLVVDPLIGDLQLEYAEALRLGRRWKTGAIRVAAVFAFLKVMITMDWTPNERGLLVRTAGYSMAAIVCVTFLFAVPILIGPQSPQAYFFFVIPQLFSLAIPIGIAIAFVGVLAGVDVTERVRAGV